jgi:hypothetical protein
MNNLHKTILLIVIIIVGGFVYSTITKSSESFTFITMNNDGDLERDDTIVLGDNTGTGVSSIKLSNGGLTIPGKMNVTGGNVTTSGKLTTNSDATVNGSVTVPSNKKICIGANCIDTSLILKLNNAIKYPRGYFEAAFLSNTTSNQTIKWDQLIKTKNFQLDNPYYNGVLTGLTGNIKPSAIMGWYSGSNNLRDISISVTSPALGFTAIIDVPFDNSNGWIANQNNTVPAPSQKSQYPKYFGNGPLSDPTDGNVIANIMYGSVVTSTIKLLTDRTGFTFDRNNGISQNGFAHVSITFS